MSDNVFKRKTIMIDDDDDEIIIKEKLAQNQKIPISNNKSLDKHDNNPKTNNNLSHQNDSKPPANQTKKSNGNIKSTETKKVNSNNEKKTITNSSSKPKANNTQSSEKVLNKKRKKESSDSSESSDEEEDSDDSESDDSSSQSDESSKNVSKVKKTKVKKVVPPSQPKEKTNPVLKTKESLVHQFLKRWWYAYSWPNKEDYSEELKSNKLRKVEVYNWRIEREVDDKGLVKCIELSGFKGVFRDSKGILYDFRPKDMCPSYDNFMKKDEKKIYDFLIKALQEQIKALESSEKYSNQDDTILENIKEELELTLENYNKKFK